jgi:hypothetical protein
MGRGRGELSLRPPWASRTGGVTVDLTDEERATREALREEYDRLEAEYSEADELPDEIDARLGEIEQALDAFEHRPAIYDPADIAIAGVFVSLDADGSLSVDRGYVRPEDEPVETEGSDAPEATATPASRPRPPSSAPSSPSAASLPRTMRRTASSRCPSASSSS